MLNYLLKGKSPDIVYRYLFSAILCHMTSLIQGHVRSGQVIKGRGICKTLLGSWDTCFMVKFAFKARWRGSFTHTDPLRQSSGQVQVKLWSRSGQTRWNFTIDILAHLYLMQNFTGVQWWDYIYVTWLRSPTN